MNRVTLILVVAFALAFLAGGVVGVFLRSPQPAHTEPPAPREDPPRGPGRGLTEELKLTGEQQEKMREIWSGVMSRGGGGSRERSEEARRRRDEKIQALLNDPQRQEYRKILDEYDQFRQAIRQQWHDLIEQAVAETKKILTPEQAKEYEEIRKKRRGGRGSRDRSPWRSQRPRGETSPASRPSRTQPAREPDAPTGEKP